MNLNNAINWDSIGLFFLDKGISFVLGFASGLWANKRYDKWKKRKARKGRYYGITVVDESTSIEIETTTDPTNVHAAASTVIRRIWGP